MSDETKFNIVLTVLIIVVAVVLGYIAEYRRRNRKITNSNASVLLTYYTDGVELLGTNDNTLENGLRYSAFSTTTNPLTQESAIIYKVILPFATTIHLLGIPKKTGATPLDPSRGNSIMERVDLEGDYNQMFNLFAEKNMQTDARYVLDPKAMVFTLDFCQSQSWEIVGNELYFVDSTNITQDENDTTTVFQDIIPFIEQIRPAIERPLSPKELLSVTPYGKDYREDLQCPLCNNILVNEEDYFHCPDNHGVLLSGGLLRKLVNGELVPKLKYNNPQKHTQDLHCPSCSSPMHKVAYGGGDMIIDSCSVCAYRWLDAGEYTK